MHASHENHGLLFENIDREKKTRGLFDVERRESLMCDPSELDQTGKTHDENENKRRRTEQKPNDAATHFRENAVHDGWGLGCPRKDRYSKNHGAQLWNEMCLFIAFL